MRSRIAGFSLVELMVAVGIIGILAVIAVPRYKSFLVQARRGEAKANLSHLASLQEVYKVEHYTYYQGSAMIGTKGIGYKDGDGNDGDCDDPNTDIDKGLGNYLGFRPGGTTAGCEQLRYFYQFNTAGNVAMASAASDADPRFIYPDCNGDGKGTEECGYEYGDALTLAMSSGKPVVCRNIAKYCPDGATFTPPVPPQTCDPATQCCDASDNVVSSCPGEQTLLSYPHCCTSCSCGYDGETRTGEWTTSGSTPSGAMIQADAYTCEILNQKAEFTETWSASPAACEGSIMCRADNEYYEYQGIPGLKLPDCDTGADRGISACACVAGDTRTSGHLNDCCAACTYANSTTTWSGETGAGVDLNLGSKYVCDSFTEAGERTITYHGGLSCVDDRRTLSRIVCGEVDLTNRCYSWCTGYPADGYNWGDCKEKPGSSPRVCQQKGTAPRKCSFPTDCASSSSRCKRPDYFKRCKNTIPVRKDCTCPTMCGNSPYTNHTVQSAREHCDQQDDMIFTETINGTTSICECNVGRQELCFDHEGDHIPQAELDDIIEDCRAAAGKTWDDDNCVCLGPAGGTYKITLCTSPAVWDIAGLKTTVGNIITNTGTTMAEFNDLKTNPIGILRNNSSMGEILKKIRCGSPGC